MTSEKHNTYPSQHHEINRLSKAQLHELMLVRQSRQLQRLYKLLFLQEHYTQLLVILPNMVLAKLFALLQIPF
jgi:hypothetical protein